MNLENRYYYEEGLIIDRRKIGDGDLILLFYGKEKGKYWVKAPGALKIKNRLRGKVEVITFGKGYFVKRKELDLLINWEVMERFIDIKRDVDTFIYVTSYIKRAEKFLPEGVKDKEIFDLLYSFLKEIRKTNTNILGDIFLIKLWQKLGFLPFIPTICAKCGKKLNSNEKLLLDIKDYKVYCVSCNNLDMEMDLEVINKYNEILTYDFKYIVEPNRIMDFEEIKNLMPILIKRIEQEV